MLNFITTLQTLQYKKFYVPKLSFLTIRTTEVSGPSITFIPWVCPRYPFTSEQGPWQDLIHINIVIT